MKLDLLPDTLLVARLPADAAPADAAAFAAILAARGGGLASLTATRGELSLVAPDASAAALPAAARAERGWRALRVAGPLDFSLVGILAALAAPLAAAGVSIFALSTFDTDYLLVRDAAVGAALAALAAAGHDVDARAAA